MKILMVCLGNICRSPLAEGMMRHLVKENNLDWEIASAGTGDWHIGKAPDYRSIAVAKAYGYDIAAQRARLFTQSNFNQYDYIFAMDSSVYNHILSMAKTDEERIKVRYFLADEQEVIDPYFDSKLFDQVGKEIESRCKKLIIELNN